jgi:hypothetical protein
VENAKSVKKITYFVARRDLIGSFPGPPQPLQAVGLPVADILLFSTVEERPEILRLLRHHCN